MNERTKLASSNFGDVLAPEGQVFVCGACGKTSRTRHGFSDTSCMTWAVLVHEDSIERHPDGRVKAGKAVGVTDYQQAEARTRRG